MSAPPLVSVVIRTKNRRELLGQAIQSVARQSYRSVEAVVVNDGGAAVEDVAASAAAELAVTFVDLQPGRGRSAAANAGIAAAHGEWIIFLDDDDLLAPNGLLALVEAGGRDRVVPYGVVDAYFYQDHERRRLFRVFDRAFDRHALLFENFIPMNACLLPAATLHEIGGVDERLECFEDWDLFLRLADVLPFRFVAELVAEYRIFDEAFITGRGGQDRQHVGRVAIYTKHAHRYTPDALSRMQHAVKTEPLASQALGEELERRLEACGQKLAEVEKERGELFERLGETQRVLRAIEASRGWRLYQWARRMLGRR